MKHLFFFSITLSIGTITPVQPLIESLFDGLNFNYAREIAFSIDKPNLPIELYYKLRWGYQGAGEANTPFSGINGHLKLNFNYDGLSFQVRKSQSLAPTMQYLLEPIESISPCQEFYLKLCQLIWTVGQQTTPDPENVKTSLQTLVARLKLTPGGTECMLYTLPILTNINTPSSLENLLTHAPDLCVAHFITISQKAASLIALLTGQIPTDERARYLQALLEQINYYDATCIVQFPGQQLLIMPFDAAGAGNPDQPLNNLTLSLIVPSSTPSQHTIEWSIELNREQAGLLRLCTLLLHHRRSPLPSPIIAQEIATLCSRLSLTPTNDGQPSSIRALLSLICRYYQSIINYSFQAPITTILDTPALILQLCRITYHTSSMNNATSQQKADFATVHTAHALRWYQGFIALSMLAQQKAQLNSLAQQGVVIDWELFIKTLVTPVTI